MYKRYYDTLAMVVMDIMTVTLDTRIVVMTASAERQVEKVKCGELTCVLNHK